MEHMRQEPIFTNNRMPDLFTINTDPHHPLLKVPADFIRKEYFKVLNLKTH